MSLQRLLSAGISGRFGGHICGGRQMAVDPILITITKFQASVSVSAVVTGLTQLRWNDL